MNPEERFWTKVDVGLCWEWTASLKANGYGQFNIAGIPVPAHRVAWRLLVGPVSPGLELDHLCRNRRCVNPDHLEPVTRAENIRRGIGNQGERHPMARLTGAAVRAIRQAAANGATHESLAASYGVHRVTITSAVTGATWKHID